MSGRWHSKADVLQDLAEVAPGLSLQDVDDEYIVYGEQAPPNLSYEEDDELELRFGQAEAAGRAAAGPDLVGIKQMLRMVQESENIEDEEEHCPESQIVISKPSFKKSSNRISPNLTDNAVVSNENPQDTSGIVIKSKLNPNVKEFVPKYYQNESSCSLLNTSADTNAMSTSVDIDTTNVNENISTHTENTPLINNEINDDISNEKRQLAIMLKKQISTTKNDSLVEVHKTNSAIVKLLKLYAEPPAEKSYKLLTPEYFEKISVAKCDSSESKMDRAVERCGLLPSVKEPKVTFNHLKDKPSLNEADRRLETFDADETVDTKEKLISHNEDAVVEQSNTEIFTEATQLTPDMIELNMFDNHDPHIKASIDKVNNWFNSRTNTELENISIDISSKSNLSKCSLNSSSMKRMSSPLLNASAVTYKRKDTSCASPSGVIQKKIPKPVAEFKPTSFADELHKKYSERTHNSTPPPQLNIWEKLEADLKNKDKEIKQRKKRSLDSGGESCS